MVGLRFCKNTENWGRGRGLLNGAVGLDGEPGAIGATVPAQAQTAAPFQVNLRPKTLTSNENQSIMEEDICRRQRLEKYDKAPQQLREAVMDVKAPNQLAKEGTIQRFEFTHELAWKLMKDYLGYEGITGITGSRSAIRQTFNKGLIQDGETWMDMIESRNSTVHNHDAEILEKEYHYAQLDALLKKMQSL